MLAVCAVILAVALLYAAKVIFAPATFALFIVAIVWPVQRTLQARIPKLLALAVTILLTVFFITAAISLVVWGITRAGQWLIDNASRLQTLYTQSRDWLDAHWLHSASVLAEQFNVTWLIRAFQELLGALRSTLSFIILTLVLALLGLLEVDHFRKKLEDMNDDKLAPELLPAVADIATKLRKFMILRSVISLMTGALVAGFSYVAGLDLWLEWGVIAFALNYIPFIGPLIATVLPTIFAIAQFESWQMGLVVLVGMNVIQFVSGNYLEPRMAGTTLSLSPFMVLFAVLFWSFLWGLPGAFIGVPILIAIVSFCERHPSSQWIAHLMSDEGRAKKSRR
jgi:predicted PurR-regulated permease PerM